MDNFAYFFIKTYVVGASEHLLHRFIRRFIVKDHQICTLSLLLRLFTGPKNSNRHKKDSIKGSKQGLLHIIICCVDARAGCSMFRTTLPAVS